jgi:hypothetical protein
MFVLLFIIELLPIVLPMIEGQTRYSRVSNGKLAERFFPIYSRNYLPKGYCRPLNVIFDRGLLPSITGR